MQLESDAGVRVSLDVKILDELTQRQIKEAKLQFNRQSSPSAAKVFNSPSKEILECEFLRKFSTSTFDYYSGVSEPVQHDIFRTK